MCRRALATLLTALAPLVVVAPAAAGMADRLAATFELMADNFIRAAQPIEGVVAAYEGNVLYLDLGEGSGAQVGQELVVFRKGDPFYHPITQRVLGQYEDQLGHAQIRRVAAHLSEAVFIPKESASLPRAGDGIRITRARIRVAITPVLDLTHSDTDVRRVPYLMANLLERSKRFQVVDPLAVSDMFANGAVRVEEVLARPERAVRVAANLEVSGWLVPVVLERNGVTYLDTTWISALTGTPLFSRRQPLVPTAATEEQRFPWEPRAED